MGVRGPGRAGDRRPREGFRRRHERSGRVGVRGPGRAGDRRSREGFRRRRKGSRSMTVRGSGRARDCRSCEGLNLEFRKLSYDCLMPITVHRDGF